MWLRQRSISQSVSPRVYEPQLFNRRLDELPGSVTAARKASRRGSLLGLVLIGCIIATGLAIVDKNAKLLSYASKSSVRLPTSALLQVSNSCGRLQARSIFADHLPATRSFVYVASNSPADSAHCTPAQLVHRLGAPSQTTTVTRASGVQPARVTWLYHGAKPVARHPVTLHVPTPLPPKPAAPILALPPPPTLEQLLGTACAGSTEVNIVAHQDDDLLFINPQMAHAVQSGECVRTIYLTAGDDGRGRSYWLARERGAEMAYASILGGYQNWNVQTVSLRGWGVVTVAKPVATNRVSLVFFNLPDGSLTGTGFDRTGHQSLSQLLAGTIGSMSTVDRSSRYTKTDLIKVLSLLLHEYAPTQINTQADDMGMSTADHPDHIAAGQFAKLALDTYVSTYAPSIPPHIQYYLGYPIRDMDQNLSEADSALKSAAFFAYAAYDTDVCQSAASCEAEQSAYALYLGRQYTADH